VFSGDRLLTGTLFAALAFPRNDERLEIVTSTRSQVAETFLWDIDHYLAIDADIGARTTVEEIGVRATVEEVVAAAAGE
jgi:hypothetical protein